MKRRKLILSLLLALLVLLAIYIGSYVMLSVGGSYEPFAIGLGGVKSYAWAPRGFVVGYKWQRCQMIVYSPLWCLDARLWHTEEKIRLGKYPIDEVKREDIWKVYQAYGLLTANGPSEIEEDNPTK